jgi:plastocyanin
MDRRRTLLASLVVTAALVAALLVVGGPAGAGSGCHSETATVGTGTTVELADNCFSPTILRVRPGQLVTFVQKDAQPHTVSGANLSFGDFEELRQGAAATYRFDGNGVYPYFCAIHPGMIGAVVVGDGTGAGAASSEITVAPVDLQQLSAENPSGSTTGDDASPAAATSPVGTGFSWWAVVALGLAFTGGFALAFSLRTRMRRGPAPGA